MSQQRSFGPFSGLQLTVILVALIAAIGIPGSVFAIDTFSNVAVEDPVSGVKATVDSQHRLKTLDTVSGNVLAQDTAPASFVRFFGNADTSCTAIYTVPAGKALVLKSVTAEMGVGTATGVELDLYSGSTCDLTHLVTSLISDRVDETVAAPLGSGVGIPAGSVVSIESPIGEGAIMAYGYLVAASAVPAGTVSATRPQAHLPLAR